MPYHPQTGGSNLNAESRLQKSLSSFIDFLSLAWSDFYTNPETTGLGYFYPLRACLTNRTSFQSSSTIGLRNWSAYHRAYACPDAERSVVHFSQCAASVSPCGIGNPLIASLLGGVHIRSSRTRLTSSSRTNTRAWPPRSSAWRMGATLMKLARAPATTRLS